MDREKRDRYRHYADIQAGTETEKQTHRQTKITAFFLVSYSAPCYF